MDKILAVLLISLAAQARAATHTLEARVSRGPSVYSHVMKVSEGEQMNFAGPVSGGKSMIFNAIVAPTRRARQYDVTIQLEVSGGQGSQGPSIQVQTELYLRPGGSLLAAECGQWVVELTLDALGTLGKQKRSDAPAWNDGGLGNYRVTANVDRGSAAQSCKVAAIPGGQSSVDDGLIQGGKRFGMILQAQTMPRSGNAHLKYGLVYSPPGMTALQFQKEADLTFGAPKRMTGQGYRLSLLAEGGAPTSAGAPSSGGLPTSVPGVGAPPAADAPPAVQPGEAKAVPLLR